MKKKSQDCFTCMLSVNTATVKRKKNEREETARTTNRNGNNKTSRRRRSSTGALLYILLHRGSAVATAAQTRGTARDFSSTVHN